jgi:hypothetical protein
MSFNGNDAQIVFKKASNCRFSSLLSAWSRRREAAASPSCCKTASVTDFARPSCKSAVRTRGLAICEAIARSHGSAIAARASPLGSVLVRIELPLHAGAK